MRQVFARRAYALLATGIAVAPFAAHAQTRDQIRERDDQLYQQNQSGAPVAAPSDDAGAPVAPSYGGGSDQGGAAGTGGNLTAQLLDRVSTLESEVRSLRGRVDVLEQQLQTSTATLNKQIGDLGFQLQQNGAGGRAPAAADGIPAAPAAPPSAAASPAPRAAAVAPRLTPESSLRAGNAALARHDYDTAAGDAQAALHGPHAADAQYLLGSAYAGQRNYQQAAVAYYGAYTRNPHGPMAPSALLHVGTSMTALGQTGAACEALGKLGAEFPGLHGGVATSATALRRRLHC